MATQLKDLKFNDYGVKGTVNSDQGADFTLSGSDVIGYMAEGSGASSPVFTKIMALDYSGTGCSTEWHFYGYADKAGIADSANSVYDSSGGSALYYDSNYGWTLNVVAGSAKSVYDSSGGSALYYDGDVWVLNVPASYFRGGSGRYDFSGGVSLPTLAKSGGSSSTLADVESWIGQFCQSVEGRNLVVATSA